MVLKYRLILKAFERFEPAECTVTECTRPYTARGLQHTNIAYTYMYGGKQLYGRVSFPGTIKKAEQPAYAPGQTSVVYVDPKYPQNNVLRLLAERCRLRDPEPAVDRCCYRLVHLSPAFRRTERNRKQPFILVLAGIICLIISCWETRHIRTLLK